jgi:hypothetical protein
MLRHPSSGVITPSKPIPPRVVLPLMALGALIAGDVVTLADGTVVEVEGG